MLTRRISELWTFMSPTYGDIFFFNISQLTLHHILKSRHIGGVFITPELIRSEG